MPVPGENSNTQNQAAVTQNKVNTPSKQNNQQMIKNATPQKQQLNTSNNAANTVKPQPVTPQVTANQTKTNNNNQSNGTTPKKADTTNPQQQNNNNNTKNANNKNQNNASKGGNANNGNNNNKQVNNKPGFNQANHLTKQPFDKTKQLNNNKQPFDKSKYHLNRNNNNDTNQKQHGNNNFGNNKFQNFHQNGHHNNHFSHGDNGLSSRFDQSAPVAEKKFTGRCRLFCGNLPADLNEADFKELFKKFGETGECFLNTQRSFGFIKLDTRINAEQAKQELDGTAFKGRTIRVRFATHGAAVKVKNLSPFISNEYLEQAFSMFGPVERAVVVVDDKGRPTGEGIVEFERKPASIQCINKCQENCFILTSYPKPIVVEPLEQKDEEDGLPEKSVIKNSQFYMEREAPAHFASNNSNEHKLAMKWRELYELEKQITEEGKRRIDQAREMLEFEIEQALIENKTMQLKEDLRMKQEELQRIEDMRKGELSRRQDLEMRRMDDERQRQEQMLMMQKQGGNGNMSNQRGNNNNMQMQGQFDQQGNQMNQPNQAHGAMQGNNSNNQQRRGNNNSNNNQNNNFNNQNNQNFADDIDCQELNNLPPAQQQALIAAQLSFAMAAAAQNNGMGNGMFDQNDQQMQQQNNNNFNNNGNNNNHGNGGQKNNDQRGGNSGGNNNRRQFDRRGGNNRGGNRDDSYPGFDTKRARF